MAGTRSRDENLAQLIRSSVDVDSAAAQLGRLCLPTLVPWWLQVMTTSVKIREEEGGDSTRHHGTRVQAANHAPSLLAGDAAVLQTVAETCLQIASSSVLER
jgi:hypothetical protein